MSFLCFYLIILLYSPPVSLILSSYADAYKRSWPSRTRTGAGASPCRTGSSWACTWSERASPDRTQTTSPMENIRRNYEETNLRFMPTRDWLYQSKNYCWDRNFESGVGLLFCLVFNSYLFLYPVLWEMQYFRISLGRDKNKWGK